MDEQENPLVLVVEDDVHVVNILKINLSLDRWEVVCAQTCHEAQRMMQQITPDVIILDLQLPGMDGVELCRRLRRSPEERLSRVPILMLTARATQFDKVAGLTAGADDYVTKPFDPRELDLRLRALLRRAGRYKREHPTVITVGALTLNQTSRTVKFDDTALDLCPQEFDLLLTLAQEPDRAFSRQELQRLVWGYSEAVPTRTVDVHISRLRNKLGAASPGGEAMIETVRRFGYKLSVRE